MEEAVQKLEESTKSADERISKINTKLEQFEQNYVQGFATPDSNQEEVHVSVLGLLREVSQVKGECEDLQEDLSRVLELKTQISKDIESQVNVVNNMFTELRSKIINHANQIHGKK